METIRSIGAINKIPASILTMGSYDGLHRGHQEIIKRVVSIAQIKNVPSVVVTFDPHPRHILEETTTKLPLILNLENKLKLLEEFGIDYALVIPFTKEFSEKPAHLFLDDLIVYNFNPAHIIIGYDHHFGFKRDGSPEFLREYCQQKQIHLDIVKPVADEGLIISSTNIRKLITSGYVRRASFELGWVYGFRANVIHGKGRGKVLHYPTANFTPLDDNQLLPKNGVYLTRGRVDGQQLYGMCNLGVRPTFSEGEFVMEVHFFNPTLLNIYNRIILVEFLERIREEKKFNSQDELIEQLKKDETICKQLQKKYDQED